MALHCEQFWFLKELFLLFLKKYFAIFDEFCRVQNMQQNLLYFLLSKWPLFRIKNVHCELPFAYHTQTYKKISYLNIFLRFTFPISGLFTVEAPNFELIKCFFIKKIKKKIVIISDHNVTNKWEKRGKSEIQITIKIVLLERLQ